MTQENWSNLAFSLGMPAQHRQRSNSETQKLAQRMKKRKVVSASQTLEYLKPFIDSIVAESPGISQQYRCLYHGDAVPTDEVLKNTVHRLPTPKPAVSLGYYKDAFSIHHDELQSGIIMGPNADPCDLNHISQPVIDHFWPFLIVELSDKSMLAARQASAVSAATCSNALAILAGAASIGEDSPTTTNSFEFDPKMAKTFSLSIHGKEACLSLHGTQGPLPYVATTVATYKLDDHHDVASLADRINSITIWAQHNRLAEIFSALDALDKKVHGHVSGSLINDSTYDFDPSCLRTLKLQPPRRPDRIRLALKAGLSRWLGK